ncbi:tyrosine recombinase XerC [Rhizobium sp. TRM95796]|uniref:site-specific integrase n=1 Tax=Rhizobium sp. TRM95796 TaxID=2979862 RepID=UPI0021E7BFB1|nr:tyrosine-type recombinase/integrase [Rhizobium sp. TRM95796]MCV3767147.1 tyrosine-type recombinase/integrase [Rhizobium sp. TRM95796]
MGLVLKYVQEPQANRQRFRYRRRVPDSLRQIIGKGELVAPLGRTREEALRSYPSVHQRFEKLLAEAKRKAGRGNLEVQTKLQQFWEVVDELRELGITDPLNAAKNPDTSDLREVVIDEILFRVPEDPETGDPILENPKDALKVEILSGRASPPPASIDDAMKLYVSDKLGGNDFEYRKALRRVERIVGEVKAALDPAPPLDRFTRDHARKVRDHFIKKGLKPSSVKRELATLSGILTHFIKETQADLKNPFRSLDLPKSASDPMEEHLPIPETLLSKIRADILSTSVIELQLIWRLLEGTGCRIAEITGLLIEDIDVEGDLPHLKIRPNETRRLKNASSKREVPLVGDALEAAKAALKETANSKAVFPRYFRAQGPTNASAALRRRIRAFTLDSHYVVHSLRHGMSDRLVEAEVPQVDRNAILGHLNAGTGEKVYGGRVARLKVLTKQMQRAFGLE